MSVTSITVGGTAISTWTNNARLTRRGAGSKRGRNFLIPYRHGEYSNPDKWFKATDVMLEVNIKNNRETNLSALLAALSDPAGLVTLGGTNSLAGAMQVDVELLAEPRQTRSPSMFVFALRAPAGMWEDASASSDAGNPPTVVTTGDRPMDDMILTFPHVTATGSFLEHTDSNSVVSRVTVDAAAPTATYVVDCGARTIIESAADQDAFLTVTQPWWMRFEPNLAQSFTSNVSVTVEWRDKWAV
jgi:hypothetical protein